MELAAYQGNQVLLTGNDYGQDLDGGPSTITSPNIVLANSVSSITLDFHYYFSHFTNGDASDYLNIYLKNTHEYNIR